MTLIECNNGHATLPRYMGDQYSEPLESIYTRLQFGLFAKEDIIVSRRLAG